MANKANQTTDDVLLSAARRVVRDYINGAFADDLYEQVLYGDHQEFNRRVEAAITQALAEIDDNKLLTLARDAVNVTIKESVRRNLR